MRESTNLMGSYAKKKRKPDGRLAYQIPADVFQNTTLELC